MNGRFSLFKSRYCALSDSLSYKDSLTFVSYTVHCFSPLFETLAYSDLAFCIF